MSHCEVGPLIDIGAHSLELALWFIDNYEHAAATGVGGKNNGKRYLNKIMGYRQVVFQ